MFDIGNYKLLKDVYLFHVTSIVIRTNKLAKSTNSTCHIICHFVCCFFSAGSISSFLPTGTVKVGEEFQISCKINSFPSRDDATLNRNGSLLNTCFQDGGCNRGDSQNIDGAVFSFTGDAEGIHLTINHLPQSEVGLLYVCIKDGSVEYTVAISKYP